MCTLLRNSSLLRAFTLLTIAAFLPTAAGAWNFIDNSAPTPPPRDESNPWAELPWQMSDGTELPRWRVADAGGDPNLVAPVTSSVIAKTEDSKAVATSAPKLPARELLAKYTTAKTGQAASTPQPEPIKLAQFGGGGEVDALLVEAETLHQSGAFGEAASNYVNALNLADTLPVIVPSDKGLVRFAEGLADGTIPLAELDVFESGVPPLPELSLCARYHLVSTYAQGALRAGELGNVAAYNRLFTPSFQFAAGFCADFPDSHYIQSVYGYRYDLAKRGGLETLTGFVQECMDVASARPTAPKISRLGALQVLAAHHMTTDPRTDLAQHYCGSLAALGTDRFAESSYFQDPNYEPWTKAWTAYVIGWAYKNLRKYGEAATWFTLAREKGPTYFDSKVTQWIGYQLAAVTALANAHDPYEGILAYDAFLTSSEFDFPLARSRAYLDMAGLYMRAGDYPSAREFYQAAATRYPDTDAGRVASGELDYIDAYLSNSVAVMGSSATSQPDSPTTVAKLCGPYALHRLLAGRGIEVSVEDLARETNCDGTGTSMLSLADAARAHGVALLGTEAGSLSELSAPFIAHLAPSHFVLVRELTSDAVTFEGLNQPRRTEQLALFEKAWSGKALVPNDSTTLARQMSDTAMAEVRGGFWGDGTTESGGFGMDSCPRPGQQVGTGQGCSRPLGLWTSCSTRTGCNNSPTARVGVPTEGVTPLIRYYESALQLEEQDLSLELRGALGIDMTRSIVNNGFLNPGYTRLGKGWSYIYANESSWGNVSGHWTTGEHHDLASDPYVEVSGVLTIVTPLGGSWTRTTEYEEYRPAPDSVGACVPDGYTHTTNGTTYEYEGTAGCGSDSYDYSWEEASATASTALRLTKVTSAAGDSVTLEYDSNGLLTKVAAPGSDTRHMAFNYDGNGRITKVQLKKGSTELEKVDYEYNTSGELTKVIDNDGAYVLYEYASATGVTNSRYISKITDKMGNELNFAFAYGQDAQSNWRATKITVSDDNGLTTVFDRGISSNVATVTNWDGTTLLYKMVYTPVTGSTEKSASYDYYFDSTNYERWSFQYDSNGNQTKVVGPSSAAQQEYAYDTYARLTGARTGAGPWTTFGYANNDAEYANTITGPDGLVTNVYYDSNGLITKVTHPSVGTNGTRWAYDSYGQVTTVTDPADNVTTYAYDSVGNLTSVTDPNSSVTTFAYDDFGRVTSVTDPRSKTTAYEYAAGGCSSCGGGGRLISVTDAETNETTLDYDLNGNLTKVTDALLVETDYEYDALNHITKITSPSGSGIYMTMDYDLLGRLTARTDFEGKTTYYDYDHMDRVVQTEDGVGTVSVEYNADGQMTKVTDGNSHYWTYAYDTALRLTSITDPVSKYVKYFYNSYGQLTKVGAGSSGTFDPTEYEYSATTGLMTKVKYWTGANHYDANYAYDSLGRVSALTDWISTGMDPVSDGLRYGYDDGGRLTSITDYDDSVLTYEYDAAGNVTLMTDYHDNETEYTYTDRNQLSTLTAPGDKTWTFDYNELGQPTDYDIPNGMTCNYGYDTRNRLTAIEYKDGSTVLDGFYYDLDDTGNITKTTNEDGSYWDYEYDDRYRLTSADRSNSTGHVKAAYSYTYDDGDNILTKVEPFMDDFDDGNVTGWSQWTGTWSGSSTHLENTSSASAWVMRANTDADLEMSFRYLSEDTSNNGYYVYLYPRYVDTNNRVMLYILPNKVTLSQVSGGTYSVLDEDTGVTTAQDTWYDYRVVCDGADIEVWRSTGTAMPTKVLETSSCTVTSTANIGAVSTANSYHEFDDLRIHSDSLSNTTTFAINTANELSTMTDPNGTTTFGFDDWGQMTSKARNSYAATYGYNRAALLSEVTSTFPGETNVTYEYGANLKRRERTVGSVSRRYKWLAGFTVVNEEDSAGTLLVTRIGLHFADCEGADPSSGAYFYCANDNLLTPRSIYNESASTLFGFEVGPYGEFLQQAGEETSYRFTSNVWDDASQLYYTQYRIYSPEFGRWLTADPMGFVDSTSLYSYVSNNPIARADRLGLWGSYNPSCPGHTRPDYDDADKDPFTSPFNPFATWIHFQNIPRVNDKMRDAVAKCKWRKFKLNMHAGQDYFSHYRPGYRWWKFGHACDSLRGLDPDSAADHPDAYENMRKWTEIWELSWMANCGALPLKSLSPHYHSQPL